MILTKDLIHRNYLMDEILDKSNDGLNVVDKDGIIIYANKMSAEYANTTTKEMIGKHIKEFYREAVLLKVLENKKPVLDQKIHYVGDKKYIVNSYPLLFDGEFIGAYSIFKDIRDIESLNRQIAHLQLHLAINKMDEKILDIIGNQDSLETVLTKARRTVGALGGPRHSIITGESGTGKTMLANLIYNYAKEVGVIDKDAPFIEVNCAQFTNPDIAAVEIFGSETGAYTGARQKKGLFEQAHGGILFLDEAHALEDYQNLLLKAIESGKTRRVGGAKDIEADVIIIAASTRDLKTFFLPELYQRLAQYAIHMPSLSERSLKEKELLFDHFVRKYEDAVREVHNLLYNVNFTAEAKNLLMKAHYPRNIRQFKDVINYSIDAASPLISDIHNNRNITTIVESKHVPFETIDLSDKSNTSLLDGRALITNTIADLIIHMNKEGLGPRKISKALKNQGYNIEYYQVAYFIKKNQKNNH